jgi:large subunit ribosomal protein L29
LKIADVRALSSEEIQKQLETTQKELLDLRFQLVTKQLVNHRRLLATRKKIAQLNTVIRERELSIKAG